MFVSHPEYEFPIPPALEEPGSRHWRMMELSLHAPWFLLSVEVVDPDVPDLGITRTLCIAWEYALAEVLRPIDAARVKGIVCMMPAWQSPTGQWWSREIRELWVYSSPGGKHVVLADTTGEKFDCGLIPEHVGDVNMELLLRVDPKPAGRGPNHRSHREEKLVSGAGNPGVTGVVAGGRDEQQVERRFEIRKQIMLGFFNGREQYDVLIDPGQGKLMFNDRDIYWLIDNGQRMSDSINDAIPIWLSDGSIEEVLAPSSASTVVRSDEPSGRGHEE